MVRITLSLTCLLAVVTGSILVPAKVKDFRELAATSPPVINECAISPLSTADKQQLDKMVDEWIALHPKQHSELLRGNSTMSIRVPVHFHILVKYKTDSQAMLKRSVANGYMRFLNKVFNETPFTFVLKSVSQTVNATLYQFSKSRASKLFRSELQRGDERSLNVYLGNPARSGVKGWSSLPIMRQDPIDWRNLCKPRPGYIEQDGIVIQDPAAFGTRLASYQSLVHLSLRWLGLLPTDGTCP